MPELDPSIPLAAKAPDGMQALSGLLTTANNVLTYKRNQATFDADVQQKQATASSAGSKATVDAANVQPLIGQQAANTSSAQTKAESDKFGLHKDYAKTAQGIASGLLADPAISGPNYDPQKATQAILNAKAQMRNQGVPEDQVELSAAPLYMQIHTPGAVAQTLRNTVLGGMAPASQAATIAPSGVAVTNNQESKLVNTNPFAAPVGSTVGGTTQPNLLSPAQQHSVGTDINSNPIDVSRSPQGTFNAPAALPGSNAAPQISYPNGESVQTKATLEGERNAAKTVALGAQQLHDINRTIFDEASKGFATGKLGAITQDLASRTGYTIGTGEDATSYNLLGKMLARSAAQQAASMGPHTNAGLQSAVESNGSLDYTPAAIKTIARLNDAITTGAEKYHQGMEAAIANGGGIFAKRKFDQQWAENADVNALKILNASKNKDQEEKANVIKSVGGAGSEGAKKLGQKIQNLMLLETRGSL
jgi:hypothetical protein